MGHARGLAVLAAAVVAAGCAEAPRRADDHAEPAAAIVPDVALSDWTEPVEGLRYRVSMLTRKHRDEPLHVICWVRNAGDHDRKVSCRFLPFTIVGNREETCVTPHQQGCILDVVTGALAPGQALGRCCVSDILLYPGSYRLGFKIIAWPPREEQWDLKSCPRTSMLPLEVQDWPLDWYVEMVGAQGDTLFDETQRRLAAARDLSKAEQWRILARLRSFGEGWASQGGLYQAIAATGITEGIEYLVKVGTEAAAKTPPGSQYNDSYYVVIGITEAFEKCPNEAAMPWLLPLLTHPNDSVRGHAVEALAAMPKPEFAETFRRFLFEADMYPMARVNAAKGLARLGDEKTYDLIHQALVRHEQVDADTWFLTRLSEAYDELTRVLRTRRPDFVPPAFVEQDKQHLRALAEKGNSRPSPPRDRP